jgi:DNA-binding PadR family transcriptional regulator
MLELTPGNLIIQLRKLEEAGYLTSKKTRTGSTQKTTVSLTPQGRTALAAYTQALRNLLGGLTESATPANPNPDHVTF